MIRKMKTLIRRRRTALTSRRKMRLLHNNKRIQARAAQRRNEDPQYKSDYRTKPKLSDLIR